MNLNKNEIDKIRTHIKEITRIFQSNEFMLIMKTPHKVSDIGVNIISSNPTNNDLLIDLYEGRKQFLKDSVN